MSDTTTGNNTEPDHGDIRVVRALLGPRATDERVNDLAVQRRDQRAKGTLIGDGLDMPPLAAMLVEWSRFNDDGKKGQDDLPKSVAVLRNGLHVESSWWEPFVVHGKTFLCTTTDELGCELLDPKEVMFIAPTGHGDTETKIYIR